MESAEQPTIQLHQQLGRELEAMGQPAETIPAHEQPVLSEGLRRLLPEGVEEFVHGKDSSTHVRVTSAGRWQRLVERMRSIKEKFQRK